MEISQLFTYSSRLVADTSLEFTRYLYDEIDWSNRLIIIKGAKGVGKTTMMLQRIKREFPSLSNALYVSMESLWFANHTLTDLAEYFFTHGGTHLFLDEIHKYPAWQREVKNIYDMYPRLHLVVTGSSILELEKSTLGDLSRRCRHYTLFGLSFREFLILEGIVALKPLTLSNILADHFAIASRICNDVKVLPAFETYLRRGYYPFYAEDPEGFTSRLQTVITTVIESEIPSVGNIEYESVYKIKRLLTSLSAKVPYTLNISDLCRTVSVSRGNLMKLLDLLDKATLIRRLYAGSDMAALAKPEKILFDNTAIMHVLSDNADKGTVRETFIASQLAVHHALSTPNAGDLLIDGSVTFEVGGHNKRFKQIKDVPDSYVVADDIECGYGNRLPLWLLGLMY